MDEDEEDSDNDVQCDIADDFHDDGVRMELDYTLYSGLQDVSEFHSYLEARKVLGTHYSSSIVDSTKKLLGLYSFELLRSGATMSVAEQILLVQKNYLCLARDFVHKEGMFNSESFREILGPGGYFHDLWIGASVNSTSMAVGAFMTATKYKTKPPPEFKCGQSILNNARESKRVVNALM